MRSWCTIFRYSRHPCTPDYYPHRPGPSFCSARAEPASPPGFGNVSPASCLVYRVTVGDGLGGVLAAGDAAAVGRDERGGAFVAARVSPSKIGPMPDPYSFPGMKQGVNSPSPAASRGSTIEKVSTAFGSTASIGSVFHGGQDMPTMSRLPTTPEHTVRTRPISGPVARRLREDLEKAEVEEFNHHRFFVDEKLTEYMKDPKNRLPEYHGKEPEGIGPWGRFRTREWIED